MLDYYLFWGMFIIISIIIVGFVYKKLNVIKTWWNIVFCIGLFPYIFITIYSLVVSLYQGDISNLLLGIFLAVVIYWYIAISALLLIFISYYNIKKNREKVIEEKEEKEK